MTAKTFEEWCESPEGSEAAIRQARAIHSGPHAYGEAAWTASRAALLADRPDVAGAIAAINAAVCGNFLRHADQQAIADKFTPCEPKCECAGLLRARSALEALAAQLAELEAELAKVKALIDSHNEECRNLCDAAREKNACGYANYYPKKNCPTCSEDWIIAYPKDAQ